MHDMHDMHDMHETIKHGEAAHRKSVEATRAQSASTARTKHQQRRDAAQTTAIL